MKVITNDAIYVQKNDLANLMKVEFNIPITIRYLIFTKKINVLDDDSRLDFIKFVNLEEIEYLNSLDWIINYADVKDLSEEEIVAMTNSLLNERSLIATEFNSLSILEKTSNIDMINQFLRLSFKIESLRDILKFKRNHIRIELPKGIPYPDSVKHEKGLKRILNKILSKI